MQSCLGSANSPPLVPPPALAAAGYPFYQKGQMQQHRVPIWSLHFMCVRYPSTVQRQIERYAMRKVTRHICKTICVRSIYLCM